GKPKRATGKAKRAVKKAKRPAGKAKRVASKPKGVQRVPKGYHTITPHLVVKGANEAIAFYNKAFGATEHARMPTPDGSAIMHAELQIGDSRFFLNDEMMGAKSPQSLGGSPVTVNLYVEDVDALWNRAVAAGCQVTMPLADMFWGDRYGMLVDPFGHNWSMASHIEDVPPEEMGQRAAAAMAAMSGEGQPQQ
ncbi:MAG: VOC family protein, partial [bacterium]